MHPGKRLALPLLFLSLLLLLPGAAASPAAARGSEAPPAVGERRLRVETLVAPPFGMRKDGRMAGFCVDLWQALADRMHVRYDLAVAPNVRALLDDVRAGREDVAVSDVTITASRNRTLDFSFPICEGGLQIMTRADDAHSSGLSAVALLGGVFSRDMVPLLALIAALVIVPAHLIWLLERRRGDASIVRTQRYIPGIFHASYWAASTLATQADEMPKSPGGRLFAILWMFVSIVFVAYFTAEMTAHLTVRSLRGSINGPQDLAGHTVATTTGSTSEAYLRDHDIATRTYSRIEDVYQALRDGKADAVVFDSPALLYYAANEGRGKVDVVGPVFRRESYAIAVRADSPLRRPIDDALLTLQEDGTYGRLYAKWFGSASSSASGAGEDSPDDGGAAAP